MVMVMMSGQFFSMRGAQQALSNKVRAAHRITLELQFLHLAHLVEDVQELGAALRRPDDRKTKEDWILLDYLQQFGAFELVYLDEVQVLVRLSGFELKDALAVQENLEIAVPALLWQVKD